VTGRRAARRIALDILYQADLTGQEPAGVIEAWSDAGREVPAFARELIAGVTDHLPSIDLLLEDVSQGWTVARMTALDRSILRLAVEEIRYRDVPTAVAINEAVEAADELSSEDAKRFVNGVLGRIAREPG
jgi:N utilization substance protein B